MAIVSQYIDYADDGTALQGRVFYDDAVTPPRAAVLVGHQWGGRDEFADGQAEALAQLGYVGFALDMYGTGVRGHSIPENSALMTPFMEDRARVARRTQAALATVKTLPQVDPNRVAGIGFCFGGLCLLDLARSGADLRGVVSFHGLLKPSGLPAAPISAKILVLHGADDPLAPIDEFIALRNEFTAAGADWQAHIYGNAKHAFAVPGANVPEIGVLHNANAERRSKASMRAFLEEILA